MNQVVVYKQTDMRKLKVGFSNFVNMHKNHLRMLIDAIFIIGCKGQALCSPAKFISFWSVHVAYTPTEECDLEVLHAHYRWKFITCNFEHIQIVILRYIYIYIYVCVYFFLNLHLQPYVCSTDTMLQKPVKSLADQWNVKCLNLFNWK